MIAGRARRALRRLASWLAPQPVDLVYSGRYGLDVPALPSDARRAENILTFLAMEGLVRPGRLRWPYEASMRSLARVHSAPYLDQLLQPGALEPILGVRVSEADEDRFLHLQRAMVGGTMLATRLALTGCRPVINLGGGLHHGHAERGEGFCAFNDLAVAIAQAREAGFTEPILVIDLDLHDGNGTRAIFASDPTVHTFSLHNATWGSPEAVASTCVELGSGVTDEPYLAALAAWLPPVIESMRPGLIYYLAGADPAKTDAIGDWKISAEGMLARDQLVFQSVRSRYGDLPLVVTLGGGYGTEAWRYSARAFGWLLSGGRALEPPSTTDIIVRRYRHLASLMRPSELTADAGGDGFGLTEADLMGNDNPSPVPRLLDYYSANGLELALERTGFLARLRALGYKRPRLDFEVGNPSGDLLRIYGSEDDQELLVELRVKRDRRSWADHELLSVEWLLLQNPRAAFSGDRPPLPGQKHPGLGLLQEVIALMVLACDRLGLDGILFVPAHYHVAAQSARFIRFLKPEDEARFHALRAATRGLSLGDASRALAAGRLLDPATGEALSWQPMPVVVPVSKRLLERLESRPAGMAARAATPISAARTTP